MSDNALIDEIREIRHRIASECGNDPLKIALRAAEAARRFIVGRNNIMPNIFQSLAQSRTALRMLHSVQTRLPHSIIRLFDYSIISLLAFAPATARATEIEFKPGVVIEVDGEVEDSFLDNGDLVLKWTGGTGSLILPGYAKAWILEVGGGGSGGASTGNGKTYGGSAGGGAGGFVENKNLMLTAGNYRITVGNGGQVVAAGNAGLNGENSSISNLTTNIEALPVAIGGGGGGYRSIGGTGGSGGGSSKNTATVTNTTGGECIPEQGRAGGGGGQNKAGGGGGGAGESGDPCGGSDQAGDGGDGLPSSITGEEIWYAGGGGGGARDDTDTSKHIGAGGKGGGGKGADGALTGPENGEPNTGGGGGGGSVDFVGGAGGSGVVIIRITWANAGEIEKPVEGTSFVYDGNVKECIPAIDDFYTIDGTACATNAGNYTFTATLKPGMHWGDDPTDVDPITCHWSITKKKIAPPVKTATSFVYTGEEQVGWVENAAYAFSASGTAVNRATNAGTYTPTVALVDPDNTEWASAVGSLAWTIQKAALTPPEVRNFTYDGENHVGADPVDGYAFQPGSVTAATNAGDYHFTVKLDANHQWVAATPPTLDPYTVNWKIARQPVDPPELASASIVYDGNDHIVVTNSPAWTFNDGCRTNATDVGHYSYTLTLDPNYCWTGGGVQSIVYNWEITPQSVDEPAHVEHFCYDATGHEPVETNALYDLTGELCETNVGDYVVTARLKDPANYVWSTGGTTPRSYGWDVTQRVNRIVGLKIAGWQVNQPPSAPSCTVDGFCAPGEPTYAWATNRHAAASEWTSWWTARPNVAGEYWLRATVKADPVNGNWSSAVAYTSFSLFNHPSECLTDYMDITLSGYAGAETLKNYPVLVRLSEKTDGVANGFEYARAGENGENLCFTYTWPLAGRLDDILPYEVDKWDPAGESLIWVRIPELKPLPEPTVIRLYWAKREGMAVPGNDPEQVWTNFVAVYHFNGTDNRPMTDSTANHLDAYPTKAMGTSISASTIGKKVTMGASTQLQAENPDHGKLSTNLRIIKYKADLSRTEGDSGSISSPSNTIAGSNESLDEVRLIRSTTLGYNTWKQVEAATLTDPNYAVRGHVSREGVQQDYWTVYPSLSQTTWDEGDETAASFFHAGAFSSGATPTVSYRILPYGTITNELPTAMGEYVAIFDRTPEDGWALVGGPREVAFKILGHAPYPVIDDDDLSASGRILLANRDGTVSGSRVRPEVDGQGWYDSPETSARYSTYPTYWTFPQKLEVSAFNLHKGTESILWRNSANLKLLWHLQNCRQGNLFPQNDADPLASNQNYLPWSAMSLKISNHNALSITRSEVGWIVMRNVENAAVTSGCFTNGIGTIYFDAVNCRADSAAADTKIVVEYLTQDDVNFDITDDELCKSTAGDTYNYARYPSTWKRATMVPMRTVNGEPFEDQSATTEFSPVNATGGTTNNFYRVRVTLNERKPVRFRIRRSSYDPNLRPDGSGASTGLFIILDNILVSKPPQTANLVSYGYYDELKTGKEVVGSACALSQAFPSMTDRGLLGRAKLEWLDAPREADVVSSAVMHYRWRYLSQVGTKTTDWKTVYLDPKNDFWSVEPLEYSQLEGDIEYYFTADLKASFFVYSDYSGAGHAKPVGDFTEEKREVESHYRDFTTSTQRLPSNGDEWFVRLRSGKSDWESVVVEVTEGDIPHKRYPMELVADGQWRALVMLKDEYEGPCTFRFRGINRQQAGEDYTTGVDQVWSPEKTTLPLPGSGKLKQTSAGATFTLDHAAGYIEFKMSDKFETFSVARAEKQDFNHWHDAVTTGDKFHVNYTDTNSVDVAHMKSYALADDMSGWDLFSATDGRWNETFYTQDYVADFPKDIVHITHDTPNEWNAQNISFVGEKLVEEADERVSGGLAGKLLGEGKGKLDFKKTGSDTPDGLDTISFRARIGQSATIDGIGYAASGIVDDDYMFFVPLTMSQACAENGLTLDDMAVGASVSLVCCYFPYEGCYEFRISRPYKGKKRTLSLYKWRNVNGVITSTNLCSRQFDNIAWTDDRNATAEKFKRFYGAFVSCQWTTGGTKLVCGISVEPQMLDVDDRTPASHFSGQTFEGLVYTDTKQPYDSGAYGVMSKDCPARFMMPIKFEDPITLADDFVLKEDSTIKTYKYFDAWKASGNPIPPNPLTIVGADDEAAFEDCRKELKADYDRIAAGRRAVNWALPAMRLEAVDERGVSPDRWWTGIRTPTNLTQQAIVMVREKGNTSELGWEEVYRKAVKSYSLDNNVITIPLRRFGEWDLRFTTGEDAVDVVFDEIKQTRWHAPDDKRLDSSTIIFTYTQGTVEQAGGGAKKVTLQPARANEDRAVSVRSPILDGLGRVSFQYENADSEAEIWLQVATNQVSRNLYDTYTPSIESVDFGEPQTVGKWMTLKKYGPLTRGCDETLGTSGRKSVYLGWHDNEDRPVTGVFRLFVPPHVVTAAQTAAHKATGARTDYGKISVTAMSVSDEPRLSERSWRGWNLRTFGDAGDTEKRMYIADSTLEGFADATGLSCGLNNQTNETSLTSNPVLERLDEIAVSGYPTIYSPTFGSVDGQQTGVGAVSFKARLYTTSAAEAERLPGVVIVYGARNSTGDDWTFISSNRVTSTVFTNFTWTATGEIYSAIKFELRSPGYKTGVVDTGRIILDEIVISERIQPSVGFVYVRPFRQNLATKTPIDDILSPNEQPLAGESWGIQAQVAVEQLEDEIDLSKGFRVFFSYFTGMKPWGYEQWKGLPGAILDEELEQVGEKTNLIFRSTFDRTRTLVEPAATGNTVVQYMLTVKYRDKSGEAKEYVQTLTPSKWENPSWYWPVDYNRTNGGYEDTKKFSGYTILDTVSPGRAWINEVSWNDGAKSETGGELSDTNQFVEVCVPSGVDMKGWWVQVTGCSQDSSTQCRKTGKLFTFGHLGAPSSKATGKAVNGYEFFVMQSPATSRRADGGIKGLDGRNAADGTWSDASQANLTSGSLSYYQPYQFELFRPSGVLEHQFVLQGTNTSTRASSRLQYEGTNLVAILNREDVTRFGATSKKRFYAGEETSKKKNGAQYASAGVVGGTKDGEPAPGAEGTWETGLKFTAGSLNEGQVIPLGWFLPPNGTNSWVYVTVEGEHLYQTVGTNTAQSILLVVPQTSKTNVVYTADNFYELDSITVNGVTNTAPETRHNPCKPSFTYWIDHPTGTVYVVAHAGLDNRVLAKLDPKHSAYAPSVIHWLAENWPEKDAADIVPARFQCVSSDSAPKYPLSLTDMYWLDIPPFTESGGPEWLLRAGVTEFAPQGRKWMRGAWYTNILVTVKMYTQHEPTAEKYPVTRLQGLNDSRSDQPGTYKAWVSETFKIRGALSLSSKFMPFRTFIFNEESFNPEFESRIEIIDPFSRASPGYSYGWDVHPDKRNSTFWKISLDTDTQPVTTEVLKADDVY